MKGLVVMGKLAQKASELSTPSFGLPCGVSKVVEKMDKDLGVKIKELELKYDKQFDDIFEVINYLLKKDSLEKQTKERGKIGYRKK
jgi:hypothetical protein